MALIQCPECKKEISSEAVACPHCGKPREQPTPPPAEDQRKKCPKCSRELAPTTDFCPRCRRSVAEARSKDRSAPEGAPPLKNLGEIAGWLVLPAIGLIFALLAGLVQLANLLEQANLIGAVQQALLLVAVMAVACFFFSRHRWTPRLFVAFLAGGVAVTVLGFVHPPVGEDEVRELGRASFGLLIWGPYFLVSRRVKLTFVRPERATTVHWLIAASAVLCMLLAGAGNLVPQTSRLWTSTIAMMRNRSLPKMIDDQTQLVEIEGLEGGLAYKLRLMREPPKGPAQLLDFWSRLHDKLVKRLCSTPDLGELFAQGFFFRHAYEDQQGAPLYAVETKERDCAMRDKDPASEEFLAYVAERYNRLLPVILDEETEIVSVSALPGVFVYSYRLINYPANEVDIHQLSALLRPGIVRGLCGPGETLEYMKAGVVYRLSYTGTAGIPIGSIDISILDCEQ